MSNVASDIEPLIFRGPPAKLILHSALPNVCAVNLVPDDKLSSLIGHSKSIFKCRNNQHGELKKLKIRLSPNFKPGLYHAEFETEQGVIPVDIDVEPLPRLTMSPVQVSISGKSGDKVQVHLLFENKGNVPLCIEKSYQLGVYDDDGIETAFASTYRMDTHDLTKLVANFMHKIREGHGGLLKMRVLKGSGNIGLAEVRSVLVEASLSSKLKAGHHYHGVWSLNSSEYAVTVNVIK